MKTLGSDGAENTPRPPGILQGKAVDRPEPSSQPRTGPSTQKAGEANGEMARSPGGQFRS